MTNLTESQQLGYLLHIYAGDAVNDYSDNEHSDQNVQTILELRDLATRLVEQTVTMVQLTPGQIREIHTALGWLSSRTEPSRRVLIQQTLAQIPLAN